MKNQYGTKGLISTNPELVWIMGIGLLIFIFLGIITMWKIFTKAGKAGWLSLIPFYSLIVLIEISGKSKWTILLFALGIIPAIGFAGILSGSIIIGLGLAKKFNKSNRFGVTALGLFGIIGYPILAFSKAKYNLTESDNDNLDI